MDKKSEVFLGQKESVARYDLEKKKPTWSQKIDGIPGIITTYNDYLFVQGTNKWQTKHVHHMFNANTGELLWKSDEIKSYIVPHYLNSSMFFGNISGKICKLDLDSGKIQFEEKFAGVFARSRFRLFISNNKVYLTSKKKTLLKPSFLFKVINFSFSGPFPSRINFSLELVFNLLATLIMISKP